MSVNWKCMTDQEIATRARDKIDSASAEINELARRGYNIEVSTTFQSYNGKIQGCLVLTDFVKTEEVRL